MRAAVRDLDLDSFAEHDVKFHRIIVQASQNEVLLRVWDTLAVDLRIRGSAGKVTGNLQEIVESHQPIIHALGRGQGREAGMLLRNHVETVLELLKKSDSGVHRALRKDLELAKDVQQAFFPQESLRFRDLRAKHPISRLRVLAETTMIFSPCKEGDGESQLATSPARESGQRYLWPASRHR